MIKCKALALCRGARAATILTANKHCELAPLCAQQQYQIQYAIRMNYAV